MTDPRNPEGKIALDAVLALPGMREWGEMAQEEREKNLLER